LPTFDVHQHLWPEELVAVLSARREPPLLRGGILELAHEGSFEIDLDEHRLERRIERLDHDGTDIAVISLQPTLGLQEVTEEDRAELTSAWHEGARRLVAASGGRVRAFAAGACYEGFEGACVAASDVVVGGPDFDRLVEELASRDQVLFVHPGPGRSPADAPPWWASVVDYTAQVQAAYLAWMATRAGSPPRPRAIFAILAGGAPFQLERLATRGGDESLAVDPSVFLDVASYGRRALELCLSTFGVRQLVFGSDFPVVDPEPSLRAVHAFGDAVATAIREETPTMLFG
jgi:amidohydrolase family protein